MPSAIPPKRVPPPIPLYALYGEETAIEDAGFIHIESIAARSRLYDWEINGHTHQGLLQTVVMFSGGGDVYLDDQVISVSPPLAVTIPPATVHAFRFQPETHGYVLTMSEALLFDATSRNGRTLFDALFLEPRVIDLSADADMSKRINNLLDHLLVEFQTPQRGHNSLTEWLAKSVFLLIERQHTSRLLDNRITHARAELFTRFRALVEKHYLDHWPVSRYASELGVTTSKLNRVSKALSGRSAFEVAQERLLLEARRRLVYIAAPVQTLAYELGFEDPAYFSRFFKKRTGQTPAAFRRAQHEKLGEHIRIVPEHAQQ